MNYRKLIAYTSLGSALEFFDFTIYALFATYISQAFFPNDNHLVALMSTFGVFAIGYLARPIGAIVFGHIGDKFGRRNTFTLTILLMSISTLLTGLIPSYATIGIAAPIILLVLRLIQGISLGGEVSGSTVFLAEHLDTHRRGFGVGTIFAGVTGGNILASVFGLVLSLVLSHQALANWGWRVPFIVGCVLGLVSYQVRRRALESPIFLKLVKETRTRAVPLWSLFRIAPWQLLQGFCICALIATGIFTLLFLPSYLEHTLHQGQSMAFVYTIVNFALLVATCLLFGYLSDFVGRKNLLILGSMLMLLVGYPLFAGFTLLGIHYVWLFAPLFAIIMGMVNGSYGCKLIELFPTSVRYSGMALAYNLAFAVFGGLSPFVNTLLAHNMGSHYSLYYLLAIAAVLTLIASITAPNRMRTSLNF